MDQISELGSKIAELRAQSQAEMVAKTRSAVAMYTKTAALHQTAAVLKDNLIKAF